MVARVRRGRIIPVGRRLRFTRNIPVSYFVLSFERQFSVAEPLTN
jgi:hypothetical protein